MIFFKIIEYFKKNVCKLYNFVKLKVRLKNSEYFTIKNTDNIRGEIKLGLSKCGSNINETKIKDEFEADIKEIMGMYNIAAIHNSELKQYRLVFIKNEKSNDSTYNGARGLYVLKNIIDLKGKKIENDKITLTPYLKEEQNMWNFMKRNSKIIDLILLTILIILTAVGIFYGG